MMLGAGLLPMIGVMRSNQRSMPSGVVDEVLAVDRAAVERARRIVLEYQRLSARDAIHLAAMEQHGIHRILSFDAGFDGFPGIIRLR
jgi:predicted nucleic acid-binding protein